MPAYDLRPTPLDLPPLAAGDLERLSHEYALTRDPRLRDALILHHQRLVRSIAARFLGSGETLDDLIQVGNIGLINALDRFRPEQGNRFSTYATPTILGEIRRYFRDKVSSIKMPRWLQELNFATRRMTHELTQQLGRAPTTAEIALRLEVPEEHVLAALEAGDAMNLVSLDTHLDAHPGLDTSSLQDLIGRLDRTLSDFERFGDLRLALECLSAREREVIALRFFDEMSQVRIAERLNISQMHVSRLQQRALRRLREILSEDVPAYPPLEQRRPSVC